MTSISHAVLSLRDFKLRAALNMHVKSFPKAFNMRGVFYDDTPKAAFFVGDPDGTDAYSLHTIGYRQFTEITNPKNVRLNDVTGDPSVPTYVACGDADGADAYLLSKPGGAIPWVERTNPKNFELNACTFGAGLFVCVGVADGTDAYIITSPDGTTWTERSNPKNVELEAIAFSGSLFVAVGREDGATDAYIVTSSDGITWTERSDPKNKNLLCVSWSADHNLFIAGGSVEPFPDDNYLVTSPDGITWTERSNPFDNTNSGQLDSIGVGGGIVLLGSIGTVAGQAFAASLDGVSYFPTKSSVLGGLVSPKNMAYDTDNNQFIVCIDQGANLGHYLLSQPLV